MAMTEMTNDDFEYFIFYLFLIIKIILQLNLTCGYQSYRIFILNQS